LDIITYCPVPVYGTEWYGVAQVGDPSFIYMYMLNIIHSIVQQHIHTYSMFDYIILRLKINHISSYNDCAFILSQGVDRNTCDVDFFTLKSDEDLNT
jgi:hypothetical protein